MKPVTNNNGRLFAGDSHKRQEVCAGKASLWSHIFLYFIHWINRMKRQIPQMTTRISCQYVMDLETQQSFYLLKKINNKASHATLLPRRETVTRQCGANRPGLGIWTQISTCDLGLGRRADDSRAGSGEGRLLGRASLPTSS